MQRPLERHFSGRGDNIFHSGHASSKVLMSCHLAPSIHTPRQPVIERASLKNLSASQACFQTTSNRSPAIIMPKVYSIRVSTRRVELLILAVVALHLFFVPTTYSAAINAATAAAPSADATADSSSHRQRKLPSFLQRLYNEIADEHGLIRTNSGNRLALEADAIASYENKVAFQPVANDARVVTIPMEFGIDRSDRHSTILAADLKLFVRTSRAGLPPSEASSPLVRINISQWRHGDNALMTSRVTPASRSGWMSFNLTSAIRWHRDHARTDTVKIIATIEKANDDDTSFNVAVRRTIERHAHDAFFLVYTKKGSVDALSPLLLNHRQKRRSSDGNVSSEPSSLPKFLNFSRKERSTASGYSEQPRVPTRRCRLKKFVISFADVGFKHIMGPPSFMLNECSGTCPPVPTRRVYNPAMHTLLLAEYRKRRSGSRTFQPCCVPIELRAIEVMFRKNSEYRFEKWPDVTATSCGCR
ncbi:bone morphogenetic protein 2-like [Oscarella lobularis]|uniref:bone morphogenetic protein 2-like n=1 Tax=Oscarella lobularis TaxID=121494 RepID=UPI0033130A17